MAEKSPDKMLKFYQRHSAEDVTQQVELLVEGMDVKDALRFLMYQCIHLTIALQLYQQAPSLSLEEGEREMGPSGRA